MLIQTITNCVYSVITFVNMAITDGSLFGRKFRAWWQKRKISPRRKEVKEEDGEEAHKGRKVEEEVVPPWEADYQLLVCEGLFSEYLEMGKSQVTWTER